jgi:hypothetical protein
LLSTAHVMTAAAIITVVPQPWVSLPLALASHFVLDSVPHWNWRPGGSIGRVVSSLAETVVAAGLGWYLVVGANDQLLMLTAVVLSVMPDVVQVPYYFLRLKPNWLCRFIAWESGRQKWDWMPVWFGLMTQVVVFCLSFVVWAWG